MKQNDWHGWSWADANLYVGKLPKRKSVAVYAIEGAVVRVYAYCRSEESAYQLLSRLDKMANIIPTRQS